jgi:hypothetical protein
MPEVDFTNHQGLCETMSAETLSRLPKQQQPAAGQQEHRSSPILNQNRHNTANDACPCHGESVVLVQCAVLVARPLTKKLTALA